MGLYPPRMLTWKEFRHAQPALADAGRAQLYQWDIGLAFLATVRPDSGPRVHPVCPLITDEGLFAFIQPGPKLGDLRRDGRYSLHSETCPPPRHDDGFYITGRAIEQNDRSVWDRVAAQLVAERKNSVPWPGFDSNTLFEFTLERCLLMLTEPADPFPKGPTVWRATPG